MSFLNDDDSPPSHHRRRRDDDYSKSRTGGSRGVRALREVAFVLAVAVVFIGFPFTFLAFGPYRTMPVWLVSIALILIGLYIVADRYSRRTELGPIEYLVIVTGSRNRTMDRWWSSVPYARRYSDYYYDRLDDGIRNNFWLYVLAFLFACVGSAGIVAQNWIFTGIFFALALAVLGVIVWRKRNPIYYD